MSVSALSAHESDEDLASVGTLHIGPTWTQDWSILRRWRGHYKRRLLISVAGRFVDLSGLLRADTWWASPLNGITYHTNGGLSGTWTMMGWLIAFADEGSDMMIVHNCPH